MRSDKPAISVVVPVYNAGRYITFCIDSILSQTFQEFELIIVDDASSDDTYEICQRLYGQLDGVALLRNPANKGQWYARNMGITQGRGKYIYFMDNDDELLPWALEVLYKKAEEEQADVVHANLWFNVYSDGRMIARDSLWKAFGCEEAVTGMLQRDTPASKVFYQATKSEPMPWLNLYRREFLAAEGIMFPKMTFAEDNSFSIEVCLKAKRFFRINKFLYLYRCYFDHRERIARRLPKLFPYMAIMLEEYNRIFGQYSEEEIPAEFRREIISGSLLSQLNYYVFDTMNTGADGYFEKIKHFLEPVCSRGADFTAYLIYMLTDVPWYRERKEAEKAEKIETAKRFFTELSEGRSKFSRDYSYIYCESKAAVYIKGGEDSFYCTAYEWLADASLELGRYREALEAYDKAASYAAPDSGDGARIRAKVQDAGRYLDDNWENLSKQYAYGPTSYAIRSKETEAVNDVQTEESQQVVLGSVLQYKQINDGVVVLWREIMAKLPSARLLVRAGAFAEKYMAVEAGERFAAAGIDLKRVQCQESGGNPAEDYRDMDIFLGTYPVQEAERVLEALYMGMPVAVLDGPGNDARLCRKVLHQLDLADFVAGSREDYVSKVVEMALRQDRREILCGEIRHKLNRYVML